MRKLAIIGAEVTAQNYAINARMMGIESHGFAWSKGAVAKDDFDCFHPISIFEKEQIVEECRKIGVNGVVASTELTIPIAAYVADKLSLNGISLEVANVITDKYHNRELTKHIAGLYHPRYAHVSSIDDALRLDLNYPVIIKPVAEGGKRGITVVNSRDEMITAMAYAASESKRGYEVLVEEFLESGVECSVESLSYHGEHHVIQVTEKISSGPPHCVELGHFQPAKISFLMREQIQAVISASLTALGYTDGPCHTEIKIVDGKIFLIEFNARPGGDFITYPLINLSTGYYHLQGAIGIALDDFIFPAVNSLDVFSAGVCFITQQTTFLQDVFAKAEGKFWCYAKNDVGYIPELLHNDCTNMNYIIWRSNRGMPEELLSAYRDNGYLKEV